MPAFAKRTRNPSSPHRFAALKYDLLARCGLGSAVAAVPAAITCADYERLGALLRDIEEILTRLSYDAEAAAHAAGDLQDELPQGGLFVVGMTSILGKVDQLWTLHEELVALLPPERPIG